MNAPEYANETPIKHGIPTCVALVDCNNFFVSCERSRDASLEDVPVAVLSSNDGCIIARSEEVKALGIKMGMPYFQAQDLIKQHSIQIRSLNYTLYTETSARVMKLLEAYVPHVEVYSVDEAFLDLSGMEHMDLNRMMRDLRQKIKDELGIPVCIGIAPSKALAKLANRVAKKQKTTGVAFLMDPAEQEKVLKDIDVSDVWGVGRRNKLKLNALGILTGWDLRQVRPSLMRSIGSIIEVRLVRELRGESCLVIDNYRDPRKHIMSSRSFGKKITTLAHMKEALTFLTGIAVKKLHKEKLAATNIRIYLRTAHYTNDKEKVLSKDVTLTVATDFPPDILHNVLQMAEAAFESGYRYAKGAVMFAGLAPVNQIQGSLFEARTSPKQEKLKDLVNNLNKNKGGKKVIDWAGFKLEDTTWMPLSQYRSEHEIEVDDAFYEAARPWW